MPRTESTSKGKRSLKAGLVIQVIGLLQSRLLEFVRFSYRCKRELTERVMSRIDVRDQRFFVLTLSVCFAMAPPLVRMAWLCRCVICCWYWLVRLFVSMSSVSPPPFPLCVVVSRSWSVFALWSMGMTGMVWLPEQGEPGTALKGYQQGVYARLVMLICGAVFPPHIAIYSVDGNGGSKAFVVDRAS